jgi:hypothetical protein
MQYIVTYAAGIHSWLSKISCGVRIFNFRYLSSGHSYIYFNNDVRIRGNFSKPKGVGEQNVLGNTGLVS